MVKSTNIILEPENLFFDILREETIFENITFCLSCIFSLQFCCSKVFSLERKTIDISYLLARHLRDDLHDIVAII